MYYWYNKNGFDSSNDQYFNATNLPLKYYYDNESVWKTITYKNAVKDSLVKLFNDKGMFIMSETFENSLIVNDTIGIFNKRYYSGTYNKGNWISKNFKRFGVLEP